MRRLGSEAVDYIAIASLLAYLEGSFIWYDKLMKEVIRVEGRE